MQTIKRSVSFRPDIWEQLSRFAEEHDTYISDVVNQAVHDYLWTERRLKNLDEWLGPLTPEEIAEADRKLDEAGVSGPRRQDGRPHLRHRTTYSG